MDLPRWVCTSKWLVKNREQDYNPINIMGLFIYIYTILLLLLSLSLLSLSLLSLLLLLLFIYIYMLYPLKVDDLGYPAKLVYKWLN